MRGAGNGLRRVPRDLQQVAEAVGEGNFPRAPLQEEAFPGLLQGHLVNVAPGLGEQVAALAKTPKVDAAFGGVGGEESLEEGLFVGYLEGLDDALVQGLGAGRDVGGEEGDGAPLVQGVELGGGGVAGGVVQEEEAPGNSLFEVRI